MQPKSTIRSNNIFYCYLPFFFLLFISFSLLLYLELRLPSVEDNRPFFKSYLISLVKLLCFFSFITDEAYCYTEYKKSCDHSKCDCSTSTSGWKEGTCAVFDVDDFCQFQLFQLWKSSTYLHLYLCFL